MLSTCRGGRCLRNGRAAAGAVSVTAAQRQEHFALEAEIRALSEELTQRRAPDLTASLDPAPRGASSLPPPPPVLCTDRTRRVPRTVLTGHAASLAPYPVPPPPPWPRAIQGRYFYSNLQFYFEGRQWRGARLKLAWRGQGPREASAAPGWRLRAITRPGETTGSPWCLRSRIWTMPQTRQISPSREAVEGPGAATVGRRVGEKVRKRGGGG